MLTPTAVDLATTMPAPMTAVPPVALMPADTVAKVDAGGLNPAYVADAFSAFLTHERCGRHLYRSVATRTNNPVLKARYVEFGEETERHVAVYEQLIEAMGGDPAYVSPMARSVEFQDSKNLESTFLLSGSADVMVLESTMLDAVFLAEAMCHANWQAVGALANTMDAGPVRDALTTAYEEVEAEEDHHIRWAGDMRMRLMVLQADHTLAASVAQKAEEMVATVKGWFSTPG